MTTTKQYITDNPYAPPVTPNRADTNSGASARASGVRSPVFVGCAGFASFGSLIWFTCTCGHISPTALLFTVPAAVISWLTLFTVRSRGKLYAIMAVLVAVFTTLVLVKNSADTLWYGHEAIWRVSQTTQSVMQAGQSGDWLDLAIVTIIFAMIGVGCLYLGSFVLRHVRAGDVAADGDGLDDKQI